MQEKKSYSVLIAEDELLVRAGLMNIVNWAKHDMSVIMEAGNGEEAWKAYRQYRPDIVLADLRMPGMSGIELIQNIRTEDERCAIVVITCMEDFATVREVMRLGVSDYLIKSTMRIVDIDQALEKAKIKVGKPRAKTAERNLEDEKYRILEQYLVDGSVSPTEIEDWMRVKHISLTTKYRLVMAQFYRENGLTPSIKATLVEVLQEQMNRAPAFSMPDGLFLLLTKEDGFHMGDACERAVWYARENIGAIVRIAAMDVPLRIDALPQTVERLKQRISDDFWMDMSVQLLDAKGGMTDAKTKHIMDVLEESILLYMPEQSDDAAAALLDVLAHTQEPSEFLSAFHALTKMFSLRELPSVEWRHAQDALYALESGITSREEKGKAKLRPAIRYVWEHLTEGLSLNATANAAGMQSQAFSLALKRYTGMTYSELLNRQRIMRAKGLLHDGTWSIQQVSDACGFSDVAYFCRVFKYRNGCTPGEWRRK